MKWHSLVDIVQMIKKRSLSDRLDRRRRLRRRGGRGDGCGGLLLRRPRGPRAVGDADPLSLEVLLPERDLVVAAGDGEHVARHGPAEVPHDVVEGVEDLGRPRARGVDVGVAPDYHPAILGAKLNLYSSSSRIRSRISQKYKLLTQAKIYAQI